MANERRPRIHRPLLPTTDYCWYNFHIFTFLRCSNFPVAVVCVFTLAFLCAVFEFEPQKKLFWIFSRFIRPVSIHCRQYRTLKMTKCSIDTENSDNRDNFFVRICWLFSVFVPSKLGFNKRTRRRALLDSELMARPGSVNNQNWDYLCLTRKGFWFLCKTSLVVNHDFSLNESSRSSQNRWVDESRQVKRKILHFSLVGLHSSIAPVTNCKN